MIALNFYQSISLIDWLAKVVSLNDYISPIICIIEFSGLTKARFCVISLIRKIAAILSF